MVFDICRSSTRWRARSAADERGRNRRAAPDVDKCMGAKVHPSPIVLRPYRPDDASAVRRLIGILQAHLHRLEPATDRGAWIAPRYFRAMMRASRSGRVTVAERRGNVVG